MEKLTSREIQILNLIKQGYDNEEIGEIMYISMHTVKAHLTAAMKKLNARNRANAVYLALVSNMIAL